MAEFKLVISNPKTGKTYQTEVKAGPANKLIGLKVGDKFPGAIAGLSGYTLEITGASDRDGFPVRPDVHGAGRRKIVLAEGPGFRPEGRGERRRKMVRGNIMSESIAQINTKIVEFGKKSVEELLKGEEEGGETKETA